MIEGEGLRVKGDKNLINIFKKPLAPSNLIYMICRSFSPYLTVGQYTSFPSSFLVQSARA